MVKNLFKDYIYPIAVYSGGMIGVGFLSLPYIATKIGIIHMFIYIVIMTALVTAISLIFCEISLKTPDFKRFPGFAGHYLGKWAEFSMLFSWILGTIGVLSIYLLIGSQFLASVFQPIFSGNILVYTFIYFIIASVIIFFDIKVIARVEFLVISLLFLSLLLVFMGGFTSMRADNIFIGDLKSMVDNFFLPYGPLLFAFWGIGLIPEVEEMLKGNKKKLKNIVTLSTIIVSVFYFLFVLLIIGISGINTDQTALMGLKNFLPDILISISILIGALATFTAFITQGIVLKKIFLFDLKIKQWQSFIMTCLPPLIILLLGFKSFIPMVSFIGGVLLGIDGIFILLMYRKIGGKNIIVYSLSLIFLLGVIYELIYFIK